MFLLSINPIRYSAHNHPSAAPLHLLLPLTVRGHGIDPRTPLPTPQCSRYKGTETLLQRTAVITRIIYHVYYNLTYIVLITSLF